MKRTISCIAILLMATITSLYAETFIQDGIKYIVSSDSTVKVTLSYDYAGDIIIPANVTNNEVQYTVTGIGESAFLSREITSIVLPETITEIGDGAFSGCLQLHELTIPNGVTTIGSIFAHCTNLVKITMGNNVVSIVGETFSGTQSLDTITIASANPPTISLPSLFAKEIIVNVPEGCGSLYRVADGWKNNAIHEEGEEYVAVTLDNPGTFLENLSAIQTPNTIGRLKIIGEMNANDWKALRNNVTSLIDVDLSELSNTAIPNDQFNGKSFISFLSLPSNIETIGQSAFAGCTHITELSFGHDVSVGSYAFSGCKKLEHISSERIVGKIGVWAFKNCKALKKYSTSDDLTEIGNSAFSGCTKLETVNFNEGIKVLGSSVFNGCSALSQIILPSSLTSIGGNCFNGAGLRHVFAPWQTPIKCYSNGFFSSNNSDCILYVPQGSMGVYAADAEWGKFLNIKYHEDFNSIEQINDDIRNSTNGHIYNINGTISEQSYGQLLIKDGKKYIIK